MHRTKESEKARKAEYYADNLEELKRRQAQYRTDNPELVAASQREWRIRHLEDVTEYDRIRGLEQRDFIKENPDSMEAIRYRTSCRRRGDKWRLANPEKVNAKKRKRNAERWATDPLYKIKICLYSRLSNAFKKARDGKSDKTIGLLGCSWGFFMEYLKANFQPGMSFNNFGKWVIDHRKPVAKFPNLADSDQQKECFGWLNLQPLWAKDNASKHDTYPWPKQSQIDKSVNCYACLKFPHSGSAATREASLIAATI